MAVECRKGTSKQYATEVKRIDGKLKKDYIGRLSDPCVDMFVREERLRKATAAARKTEINIEMEEAKQTEALLIQVAKLSSHWKVFYRITNLQPVPVKALAMSNTLPPELPKLHRLAEICRLANQANEDAAIKLNRWINDAPDLFARATDVLGLARDAMIQDITGGEAETEALLRAKLERDAAELVDSVQGDPLLRHYAETVVLAKLDVARCELAGLRPNLGIRIMKYWEVALARAQSRFIKLEKAFRMAVAERDRASRSK
ncbi:hypothetical protein [Neorhodopirellula lusitana]|uniref:hypothetical protein n=1 Tax=Neorhodopirellula lusitana TaxID=445327 RepID=UPI003850E26A